MLLTMLSLAVAAEAPLFELVPVPPEYAAVPMATPTPAPHAKRRAQRRVPPPPIQVPGPPTQAYNPPVPYPAVQPPPRPSPLPPAPSESARPVAPARPHGSPTDWVTNDDYPSAALRAEESGTVGFRLTIDETGKVSACEVTSSSGSQILDGTTCALFQRRGRFWPARDEAGNPVISSYSNRLRWEIPEEPRVPLTSWAAVLRFTIGADSQLSSCSYQGYEAPDLTERSPCVAISETPALKLRKLRGRSKGPVTIVVRFDHLVEGMAMPRVPALAAKFKPIASWDGHYTVNRFGGRVGCEGQIDTFDAPMPIVSCLSYSTYERQETERRVTTTLSFFTDGDPAVAAGATGLSALAE